ncbi:MAG TPA: diacylglycerol kinase family protein [Anaeromyxobacteraceae bacterium]|nr:diacylglycerol kinase family protein [Anaeromyxobacteraceae bacterium]
MKPVLIVNPASAAGRTGRHFDAIARAVHAAVGEFEARFTRAVGDAVALAREAALGGRTLVVAVGGDGTASEVVDGLLVGGYRRDFGFIPRGSGGDFRRSLGLPADVKGAARALAGPATGSIDLGRIELTGPGGAALVRHFVNVASCGVSGRVAGAVNRSSKLLGGPLAFKLAAARSLLGWRDQRVRWRADGGPWIEQPVTALAVCNGRYFGGGMMVAPGALLDDGLLDVTIWSGFGLADFVRLQPKLYDGRHVELPSVRTLRARTVELEPVGDAEVLLEVDGEQPGRLPARLTVLPGALALRGLGPTVRAA